MGRQRFRHVTLPLLSPTIFFNLVLGVIGGLKVFAAAYITTDGGPAYATWFYILHLFAEAFRYLELGYASALAWFFFVIVLLLTVLQFSVSRRWVYYEGQR
jgi:multiple sugar transport system permease protein